MRNALWETLDNQLPPTSSLFAEIYSQDLKGTCSIFSFALRIQGGGRGLLALWFSFTDNQEFLLLLRSKMSYLVLARKSRPQSFAEVVGQHAVVKTLQNSIARGRIAHAILFSGVRGVGKTTLARIMAKAINCQASSGVKPCNNCPSCNDIAAGRFLDLTEIDGASNRGIQEIRELKENLKFMPAHSAYKVIIIDEVHMLTTEAFNALLKTLEEPPPHVYFMFATTEIHKIPVTILSRCQQFELKKISAEELSGHFQKLADQEGVTIEPAALSLIVREAAGSIRDGLSLLDQMFSFGEKNVSENDVIDVLGLISRQSIIQLTTALLNGEKQHVFSCLNQIFTHGINSKRFIQDLLDTFRNLLLCSIHGGEALVDVPLEELTELKGLAAKTTTETIHLKLSLLMDAAEAMQYSPQPKLTLEIAFLKIIETGNITPLTALLGQLEKVIPQLREKKNIAAGSEIPPQQPPLAQQAAIETEPPKTSPPAEPAVKKKEHSQQHNESAAQDFLESTEKTQKVEDHSTQELHRQWPAFLQFLEQDTIWLAAALRKSEKQEFTSDTLTTTLHLYFSDREDTILLAQKENQRHLTVLALDFFKKELTIEFHLPVEDESRDKNSPRMRRKALANNPLVQMTEEIFHGSVAAIRLSNRQETMKEETK